MAAMLANWRWATGNINPRTISVSRMMATPKLPVAWKIQVSSDRIGCSKNQNQPQSSDFEKLTMPAFS